MENNEYKNITGTEEIKAIDKSKKLSDAKKDIDKINEVLSDTSISFHKRANVLYKEITKNIDYAPYILTARVARNMVGDIPFSQLKFYDKRRVLDMVHDAITAYMLKLTEEINN
jgi:hypothetical protein